MARDNRKDPRVSFERTIDALMMGIDGAWRRECQLADVSASGAKLIVAGSIDGINIKEFFLLLTPTGSTLRRCGLVRVDGNEVGVRFLRKGDVRNPARRPIPVSAERG